MGFMGGIFKALGFESDGKNKSNKKKQTKASYSLKKSKDKRIEQIDGVSVYYPESLEQVKDFVNFVKEGKAVIISSEGFSKENGQRILDYLHGFVYGIYGKFIVLTEDKLFLILPEGMEVEE